jgi:hypothetical protein
MKYKLPRQKISEALNLFYSEKIKKNKVHSDRATKNNLIEIEAVSRKIQKEGLPKHLVIKKLKGRLGHGIFLHLDAKPILKGEVIAPYAGKVALARQNADDESDYAFSLLSDLILSREEQRIWDPKGRYHPRRLYSIDLDADKMGNFTRFINHSAKPNIEAQFLRLSVKGKIYFEIVYVAKKKICPGEQLLVCYEGEEKSYWGILGIKPFPMTPQTFRLSCQGPKK